MRLPGDLVSGDTLSDHSNYITIGRSMFNSRDHKHAIKHCKKAIKDKDWNNIFKDRFLPRQNIKQYSNSSTPDLSNIRTTGWKQKNIHIKIHVKKEKISITCMKIHLIIKDNLVSMVKIMENL